MAKPRMLKYAQLNVKQQYIGQFGNSEKLTQFAFSMETVTYGQVYSRGEVGYRFRSFFGDGHLAASVSHDLWRSLTFRKSSRKSDEVILSYSLNEEKQALMLPGYTISQLTEFVMFIEAFWY